MGYLYPALKYMNSTPSYDHLSPEQLIELSQSQQSEIQSLSSQYELLLDRNQALESSNQTLEFRVAELTHELAKLKKLVFGSKSERFVPANPDSPVQQGVLDLDMDVLDDRTQVTAKPHIHPGRNPLPEHLHREVIVIEPKEDITVAVKIGEEVSEVLEIQEQKLFVKRYIRCKYILKTRNRPCF